MAAPLARLDSLFERWGERLNPVTVKETRQMLRSRGFVGTFMAMLLVCLVASLLLLLGESAASTTSEAGPRFFPWYLAILLAGNCLATPLAMFQNVSAEFDGQTFEMLAITGLSPRQVVFGKLLSATVRMAAYFSAAAPFLCFTWLLHGLSLPGIGLALVIAYVCGLSACMGAMMLAALTKQSTWRAPGMLAASTLGAILFGVGVTTGAAAATEKSGTSLATLCAGLGCFGYGFLFFSLLTLGVSIAQFTPTMSRPGRIEVGRARGIPSPAGSPHQGDSSGAPSSADAP